MDQKVPHCLCLFAGNMSDDVMVFLDADSTSVMAVAGLRLRYCCTGEGKAPHNLHHRDQQTLGQDLMGREMDLSAFAATACSNKQSIIVWWFRKTGSLGDPAILSIVPFSRRCTSNGLQKYDLIIIMNIIDVHLQYADVVEFWGFLDHRYLCLVHMMFDCQNLPSSCWNYLHHICFT